MPSNGVAAAKSSLGDSRAKPLKINESCAPGAVLPTQLVAVLHRLLLAFAPLQVTSAADAARGAASAAAHAAIRIFRDDFFPLTTFIAPPRCCVRCAPFPYALSIIFQV